MMMVGMPTGTRVEPMQSNVFANRGGLLVTSLEHMVNDYWHFECYPATRDDAGEMTRDPKVGPAPGLLRIRGTYDLLEHTRETSERFILQPGYP